MGLSKREANKVDKEKRILEAAYALYLEKGIEHTSVSDIVKSAGVAKGTFYLYFKDKSDIEEQLIMTESAKILEAAVQVALDAEASGFEERFIIAVDYIIDYLIAHDAIMSFIRKNLSYALYMLQQETAEKAHLSQIVKKLYRRTKEKIVDEIRIQEPEVVVSLCIELLGASIYSSLTMDMPKPIEELRPHLHKIIGAIFTAYSI